MNRFVTMFSLPQRFLSTQFVLVAALTVLFLGIPESGFATSINVTSLNTVTLNSGSDMIVSFGTWTYASANSGYSPDPTSLQFEGLGPEIAGPLASIPGTSAQYYAGISLTGYLESMDGSIETPLIDDNARTLGLADGTLLFTQGTFTGADGTQQVSVLNASVTLTQLLSQSLFGAGAVVPWTADARIVLVNNGPSVTFGLGGAYTQKSAFLEPGLRGDGPATTSGVTLSVEMDSLGAAETPAAVIKEPPPLLLLSSGLAVIIAGAVLRKRRIVSVR